MNSISAASDAGSPSGGAGFAGAAAGFAVAGVAGLAAGGAAGFGAGDGAGATGRGAGFSGGGGAGFSAGGAAGATGGLGADSSPAGTEARATGSPGGSLCTRAVGVPIVSAFGAAGDAAAFVADGIAGSTSSADFAAGAAVVVVAAAATGAAVGAEPVADFARATGVLTPPFVEAITAAPAVTALLALGAGAPASGFFGGAGLKESRIFSAAMAS